MDDQFLIAELEDGLRLSAIDAVELAHQLWEHGITKDQLSIMDWHEDALRAPTGGQKVAINFYLQKKENDRTLACWKPNP